jgi:CTP synthase (UTP-ammonia lyase)
VSQVRIALIGDYDPSVKAHQAIPRALALAADADVNCRWEWLHTSTLDGDRSTQLHDFDGIWCVPASPYANARGALGAIRVARLSGRAFLGTCGGFQHALLEYAEAVWGIPAAHGEVDPAAVDPVIAPLMCGLVEQSGQLFFAPRSRLASIYSVASTSEAYHCRYGLNPHYAERLASGPLRVAARDEVGDVRAIELDGHPFFIGTLFQPERSAFSGRTHPLIRAFVAAARDRVKAPGETSVTYRR